MNCFQLVRLVLDNLYKCIFTIHGSKTDQVIRKEILNLSYKYRNLEISHDINYNNVVTRFAYIYAYTTAHADMVYKIIDSSPILSNVFNSPKPAVSCIGGGPGSDFLGILKFITLTEPPALQKIKCFLCDRAQAWRDSWCNVDDQISSKVNISTLFWELDVTESDSIQNSKNAFNSDLFTMIYFISELYFDREDARDFFDILISQAKPGSLFLFVDNNAAKFYEWFDAVATDGGLVILEQKEDYRFVMGWDEQADELAIYKAKFDWSPKMQAYIAYRIYQKPKE